MSTTIFITMLTLLLFLSLNHPLLLVIVLIIQTLGTMTAPLTLQENPWSAYILFLIFLGGLLIIFVYITSMIPNELTMNKKFLSFILMVPVTLLFPAYILSGKSYVTMFIFFVNTSMSGNLFPLMMTYLLLAMCLMIFLGSCMKTPIKQEIN